MAERAIGRATCFPTENSFRGLNLAACGLARTRPTPRRRPAILAGAIIIDFQALVKVGSATENGVNGVDPSRTVGTKIRGCLGGISGYCSDRPRLRCYATARVP